MKWDGFLTLLPDVFIHQCLTLIKTFLAFKTRSPRVFTQNLIKMTDWSTLSMNDLLKTLKLLCVALYQTLRASEASRAS